MDHQAANIDSAIITIHPNVFYAEVDLELVYSAKESPYASSTTTRLLEVVTSFEVPENTIVVDSWLWIEDYISVAHLIDVNHATNIYESFVVRTQDPSLLRYSNTPNTLDFNIYPMDSDSSRKVKLSFLVPMNDLGANRSVNPIVDIFQDDNAFADSYCKLILHHPDLNAPGAFNMDVGNFNEIETNAIYRAYELNLNAISPAFRVTYPKPAQETSMIYEEYDDGGYYYIDHYFPVSPSACELVSFDFIFDNLSFQYQTNVSLMELPNGYKLRQSSQYYNNPPQAITANFICDGYNIRDTVHLLPEFKAFYQ